MVINFIEGKNNLPSCIEIPTRLVVRHSCALHQPN